MLYQLNYWPKFDPGARPPDPLHAHSHNSAAHAFFADKVCSVRVGSALTAPRLSYLLSLCAVCFRQWRQYLLNCSRSELLRRFFVVL